MKIFNHKGLGYRAKIGITILILGNIIGSLHAQTNKPTTVSASVPTKAAYLPTTFGSSKANYVRTWQPQHGNTNLDSVKSIYRTPEEVLSMTGYIDGLGRQLETVTKQGSPDKKDMVAAAVYDGLGRQSYNFLPYTDTGSYGGFKTASFADQANFYTNTYKQQQPEFANEKYFYSKTIFESSELGTPLKSFAPGNSWVGSEGSGNEHGVEGKWLANSTGDSVRIWTIGFDNWLCTGNDSTSNIPTSNGYYAVGELIVMVAIDENGHSVVQYQDKMGRLILKKVQVDQVTDSAYNGWLCTYYVYDDFGQLRFIIPPKAVKLIDNGQLIIDNLSTINYQLLNELCFRYEYDNRHRVVAKKVPGQGWSYTVYDKGDRPVFAAPPPPKGGILSGGRQWNYVLYDGLGRPSQTGIMYYGGSYCGLRDHVDSVTGMNTIREDTVTGHKMPIIPGSIRYNHAIIGMNDYVATDEVVLDDGFESPNEMTAEIVSNSGAIGARAFTSITTVWGNAIPAIATVVPLTLSYYDDYSQGSLAYYTGYKNKLTTSAWNADNVASIATIHTLGMATVSRVRVIEDPSDLSKGKWLETACFYDEKGRSVEVIKENYKGGNDTMVVRYSFTGQSLTTYTAHSNPAAVTSIRTKTIASYDHGGRVLSVQKQINDDATTNRYIARFHYDALGKLLAKEIGQKSGADTAAMETQTYSYNIRGWLKGINSPAPPEGGIGTAENPWFAESLSYERGFDSSLYNGNISGVKWRTAGSGAERAYGYGYDASGRLLFADFNQNFGTATAPDWNKDNGGGLNIDFSMKMGDGIHASSAYDANGNILRLTQKGLTLNASSVIDDLTYTYRANSNKLLSVSDAATSGGLSDFTDNNKSGNDYAYDSAGNMTSDKNKRIDSIVYNQWNLVSKIVVKDANGNRKGSISYIYDATGAKLEKITQNDSSNQTTSTSYMGGYIYENNALQFFGHEEGRIRQQYNVTNNTYSYVYDYMLKDHLGNTRVTLTDERKQDIYPAATLEDGCTATEVNYYNINTANIVDKANITSYNNAANKDYYNNNSIDNPGNTKAADQNQKLYKLNGSTGSKSGLDITLKVMAGDNINLFAKSYWHDNATINNTSSDNNLTALSILGSLAATGTISGGNTSHGGTPIATASDLQNVPGIVSMVSSILNSHTTPTINKPKAYVNWILFDEQFRVVNSNCGLSEVCNHGDSVFTHPIQNIEIGRNGYLYVFCSNESNIDVFFDNLQVVHNHGPLLQEDAFYPFGVSMAGISSKAAGGIDNKYKFNSSSELNNDLDVGIYETPLRGYDAQIGRFEQGSDPLAAVYNSFSNYAFVGNNPVMYSDPTGARIERNASSKDGIKNLIVNDDETQKGSSGSIFMSNGWNQSGPSMNDIMDKLVANSNAYFAGLDAKKRSGGVRVDNGDFKGMFQKGKEGWGFYDEADNKYVKGSSSKWMDDLSDALLHEATIADAGYNQDFTNRFNFLVNGGKDGEMSTIIENKINSGGYDDRNDVTHNYVGWDGNGAKDLISGQEYSAESVLVHEMLGHGWQNAMGIWDGEAMDITRNPAKWIEMKTSPMTGYTYEVSRGKSANFLGSGNAHYMDLMNVDAVGIENIYNGIMNKNGSLRQYWTTSHLDVTGPNNTPTGTSYYLFYTAPTSVYFH